MAKPNPTAILSALLLALLSCGDARGAREEIVALKKRYMALDRPLAAAQQRAWATLVDRYVRMLTGIGNAAADAEIERFEASPTAATETSDDPKVAAAQSQLARAFANYDAGHPARRAALAAEYLLRLDFAGEPPGAVGTELKRLERTIGRPVDRAGRIEIEPAGDTTLRDGAPTEERGGHQPFLGVSAGDGERVALLRFDLKSLPAEIDDARLLLTTGESDGGAGALHVLSASSQKQPWAEATARYQERPEPIREMVRWSAPVTGGAIAYIDLTQDLRDRRRQGVRELDVQIHVAAGPAYVGYASREHTDPAARPRLVINDPGRAFGSGDVVEVLVTDGSPAPLDEKRIARLRRRPPTAPPVAAKVDLAIKTPIAKVKALLVRELPGGALAGFAQPLTATAVRDGRDGKMGVTFDQEVGGTMRAALGTVTRGLKARYGGWPRGYAAGIGFTEEDYAPEDGPSAAVAWALLIDGLLSGETFDPTFAITGKLDSDLAVLPVGNVRAKLRGARTGGAAIVAIPAANARTLDDMVVMDDLPLLAGLQVFTVESFEQARDLALAERPLKLQVAIDKFAALQRGGLAGMRGEAAIAELRDIVAMAPNHASASQVLRAALGSAPRALSLASSFYFLDDTMAPFVSAIRSGKADTIADAQYADTMRHLARIKNKLHPRATPLHTKLTDLIVYTRRLIDMRIGNANQYEAAVAEAKTLMQRLDAERAVLAEDPEIVKSPAR